jgi:hypothetical protein
MTRIHLKRNLADATKAYGPHPQQHPLSKTFAATAARCDSENEDQVEHDPSKTVVLPRFDFNGHVLNRRDCLGQAATAAAAHKTVATAANEHDADHDEAEEEEDESVQDLPPVHSGLYHHGKEPHAPGYVLDICIHNGVLSSHVARKKLACCSYKRACLH